MKRAIIIHCWTGHPEYCWYPYVREELTNRGYEVEIPFFPDILPLLSRWLGKIENVVGDPDEDTVLIGHSLGSIAVMKYLQGLPEGKKVGGAVLVSGFTNDLGLGPLQNFFEEPLKFDQIKTKANEFVLVASGNDPYITPYHTGVMRQQLNARVIWIPREHFTHDKNGVEYKIFREIVSAIERIKLKQEIPETVFVPALAALKGAAI